MSYVDNSLLPNEQVVRRARLSRVIFVAPAAWVTIGLLFVVAAFWGMPESCKFGVGARFECFAFAVTSVAGYWAAAIFLTIGLMIGLARYVNFATSEFAITNVRVIMKVGMLRRRTLEMQLVKLEAIAVDQGILGRLFRYGNIVVTGTGGTKEPFKRISDPVEFRRAAQAATY